MFDRDVCEHGRVRYELFPCAADAGKDSKIFAGIVKKANQLPLEIGGNVELRSWPKLTQAAYERRSIGK